MFTTPLNSNLQLGALCLAIFTSLCVLILDASHIGVTYDLLGKMNEFVAEHSLETPLGPYFEVIFSTTAWLIMIPAGISCLIAMAWLVVPKIRESKMIQFGLALSMFIFWFVVTVWTLVEIQGFASTFYCDDTTRHVGCYDTQAFEFSGWVEDKNPEYNFNDTQMTVDLCRSQCSNQYDFYSAVQGVDCVCIMSFDTGYNVSEDLCNIECPGNNKQMCGGNRSMSVWVSKAVGDDSVSQCFLYTTATGFSLVAVVVWLVVTALVFLTNEAPNVPFFKYPSKSTPTNRAAATEVGGAAHNKNWAQLEDD